MLENQSERQERDTKNGKDDVPCDPFPPDDHDGDLLVYYSLDWRGITVGRSRGCPARSSYVVCKARGNVVEHEFEACLRRSLESIL